MVKFKKLFVGCGLVVVGCVMWLVSACTQSGTGSTPVQPPKTVNLPLPSSATTNTPSNLNKSATIISPTTTTQSPAVTNSTTAQIPTSTTMPPAVSTTTTEETPTTTTEPPIVPYGYTPPTTTITPFNDSDINAYVLDINGLVNTPLSLSYAQIQTYPSVTLPVEIACPGVEDEWDNWTGVPLSTLLNAAGLSPSEHGCFYWIRRVFCLFTSFNRPGKGVFLAYQMNGQSLSQDRGYPLRLVVSGSEGADWLRWVTSIQVKSNLTDFSNSSAIAQDARSNIPTSGNKTCSCFLAATVVNYQWIRLRIKNRSN